MPTLLKLDKTRRFAIAGTGFVVLPKPTITENGLQAPGLRDDLDEAGQQALLTYLYERWEKREQQTAKYNWPTNWATLAGVPAAQALGFVPAETVLPATLATAAEAAPAWLQTWADTTSPGERQRFLAALGVAVTGGPLVRLRQAFGQTTGIGPTADFFIGFGEASPARQRTLQLTLRWLAENGVVVATTWPRQLLTELFDRLAFDTYDWELFAYLTGHPESGPRYEVRPNAETDLLLDDATRAALTDHNVSIAEMLTKAEAAGLQILDLSIYPESWRALTAEPLAVECTSDRATLQAEATEVPDLAAWAAAHPWAEDVTNRVFTVPGLLPQHRTLLGQPLLARRHGRLWVDRDEGHLYVSEAALPQLPDVLQTDAPDDFNEEEIAALREVLREMHAAQTSAALVETRQELTDATERARTLAAENETLKRELAELRAVRQVVSAGGFATDETTRRREGIKGSKAAAEASEQAVAAARTLLEAHPDYDCTNWQVQYSVVSGVLYKGQPLKLVVKSAKMGNLYLNPFDWLALAREQPSALLVLTPNGSFRLTPFAAIQNDERNSRFSVNFTLREHTPELLTSLAGFYRELYGETGFVQSDFLFYQPGANYTDSLAGPLRGFFGPNTNPGAGPVSAQPDDVL